MLNPTWALVAPVLSSEKSLAVIVTQKSAVFDYGVAYGIDKVVAFITKPTVEG